MQQSRPSMDAASNEIRLPTGSEPDSTDAFARDSGTNAPNLRADLTNDAGGPRRNDGSDLGADGSTVSEAVSFTEIYETVIKEPFAIGGCAVLYCHYGATDTGADLASRDQSYAALVEQEASGIHCGEGAHILVVPGKPDESLLIQKLEGSPPCGATMPMGMEPLSAETIAGIRAWIADGAPDN